ncbi:MAG: hypothetical protein SV377_07045 [Halobacteria archaeon]|nr:hypothetical protein [Halobacteria archaeon]
MARVGTGTRRAPEPFGLYPRGILVELGEMEAIDRRRNRVTDIGTRISSES